MLATLADAVKTLTEVEKLLSMLRNLSTVTGLGEKKKEKGELVLNKVMAYSRHTIFICCTITSRRKCFNFCSSTWGRSRRSKLT